MALAGLTAVPAAAKAELVFDTFNPFGSYGLFTGQHDIQGGDRVILPNPGVGNMWVLNSLTTRYGTSTSGMYTNNIARLTVYRTVNLTGTGPAFSDPFGSATQNLNDFFSTGPGQGQIYTISGMSISLNAPPTNPTVGYGIKIDIFQSGGSPNPGFVVPTYVDLASTVAGSSSSQGWYRDLNDDGTLAANEYEIFAPWTNGNLQFEINATASPIPEPASFIVLSLALGSLAAVRRRRRNPRVSNP
ncbi:MAG: PEP-CTERM sorting domain-containing protein [Armatimonadetes bacterium]|nr:PEP-CTERM sorting domain-containing protein [Armatimonadota bacterium]